MRDLSAASLSNVLKLHRVAVSQSVPLITIKLKFAYGQDPRHYYFQGCFSSLLSSISGNQ